MIEKHMTKIYPADITCATLFELLRGVDYKSLTITRGEAEHWPPPGKRIPVVIVEFDQVEAVTE